MDDKAWGALFGVVLFAFIMTFASKDSAEKKTDCDTKTQRVLAAYGDLPFNEWPAKAVHTYEECN